MKCFCCFKDLKSMFGTDDCISDGTSLTFQGGYGSIFDGDYGKIYICDSCVESRVDTIFKFDGNYILEHWSQSDN